MAKSFEEVADRVWRVGKGGWGGVEPFSNPGDCNVYLVDGGSQLALVDAGVGFEAPEIVANVREAGFDPKKITTILLTHSHCDHSNGTAWMRGVTGARVFAGTVAARSLAQPERLLIGGLRPFEPYAPAAFLCDRWLEDGEEFSVGDVLVAAVATPGHTVDSICFLAVVGGRRVLFSGDTAIGNQPRRDWGENVVIKGMLGWLDGHWSAPVSTYIDSLEKLKALDAELLLAGHGVPNDAETTREALSVGRRRLERLVEDEEQFLLFPLQR